MAAVFQTGLFVAAIRDARQSKALHCPRGSEQEAGLIESELQQRHGDPVAKAFRNWRQMRRRNYNTTSSGIDLVSSHQ